MQLTEEQKENLVANALGFSDSGPDYDTTGHLGRGGDAFTYTATLDGNGETWEVTLTGTATFKLIGKEPH